MQPKSIHSYFKFGTCVRYLQDVEKGTLLGDDVNGFVKSNLIVFFDYLDRLGLVVTKRASKDLEEFFDTEIKIAEPDNRLTLDQAKELSKHIGDVRKTLGAELMGLEAYITQSKVYDIENLINDISKLFSPKTFVKLPEIARYDLQEAGRCIAFERPTAAAFHILRGTESVLKSFYFSIVKRNRIKKLMWGNITTDLRSKRNAKSYLILINHLDNIRTSFRNPTQHPEKIYDIHEVQDLLGLCIDSINRMSKTL
jgi:hypothetical protein